jgi:hypothetical protein
MKTSCFILIVVLTVITAGCSDSNESKSADEHFLKEKTDAIDKAKEVEALMLKTVEDQAQVLEKQLQ